MSFIDRFVAKLESNGGDTSDMPSQWIKIVTERPDGTYYADYEEFNAARGGDYNKTPPSRGRVCPYNSTFVTNTGDGPSRTAVAKLAKRFRTPVVINTMPMAANGQLNRDGFEIAALHPEDQRIVSEMWSLWYHGTTDHEKRNGIVPDELLEYCEMRKALLDGAPTNSRSVSSGICYRPDLFDQKNVEELRRREAMPDGGLEIWTLDLAAIGYRRDVEFKGRVLPMFEKMNVGDLPRFEEQYYDDVRVDGGTPMIDQLVMPHSNIGGCFEFKKKIIIPESAKN